MTWNLFIDDELKPENISWAPRQVREKYSNEEWVVCRNGIEVLDVFIDRGMPSYISFDYDLGNDSGTGYDIAQILVKIDFDTPNNKYRFPTDFDFYVHSKNPIEKANIESYLKNYLKK